MILFYFVSHLSLDFCSTTKDGKIIFVLLDFAVFNSYCGVKVFALKIQMQEVDQLTIALTMALERILRARTRIYLFIFISVQNHFDNTLNFRNAKYAIV